MGKRVNNVQETFEILARLEAERAQASKQKGKKAKKDKEEVKPVSVLPQAPFLEKAKHFRTNQDVDRCADIALVALENLPEHLANSDILIFDTLIEKLTKPKPLDFESDLIDVYGRTKRGIQVISKALDVDLKTFSAAEIIQAYGNVYSSRTGRIVDAINNIRVTAIKLELLSEEYRPSGSKIRTNIVLEPDESRISGGKGASILSSYANELLSASIDLVDKAIKKGYEFQDVLSYVGTAKEFQLEPDATLTEKMCNLVQAGVDSKGANSKSVEVCTSYMADKYAGDHLGKLPIIKLAIHAKLAGIDFNASARGFIAMKMKGCTIPVENDLLRLQWSQFCQGREISRELKPKSNPGGGLLAGTDLVERARRGDFPAVVTLPPVNSKPKVLPIPALPSIVTAPAALLVANSTQAVKEVPKQEVINPYFKRLVEFELIFTNEARYSASRGDLLKAYRQGMNSSNLDQLSFELLDVLARTKISAVNEDRELISEIAKALNQVKESNPKIARELEDISHACGLRIPTVFAVDQNEVVGLQKTNPQRAVETILDALDKHYSYPKPLIKITIEKGLKSSRDKVEFYRCVDLLTKALEKDLLDFNDQWAQTSFDFMLCHLGDPLNSRSQVEFNLLDDYKKMLVVIALANSVINNKLKFNTDRTEGRMNLVIRSIKTVAKSLGDLHKKLSSDANSFLECTRSISPRELTDYDLGVESKYLFKQSLLLLARALDDYTIKGQTVNSLISDLTNNKFDFDLQSLTALSDALRKSLSQESIKKEVYVRTLETAALDLLSPGRVDEDNYMAAVTISALSLANGIGITSRTLDQIKSLKVHYAGEISRNPFMSEYFDIVDKAKFLPALPERLKQPKPKKIVGKTVHETGSSSGGLFSGTGILEKFGLKDSEKK